MPKLLFTITIFLLAFWLSKSSTLVDDYLQDQKYDPHSYRNNLKNILAINSCKKTGIKNLSSGYKINSQDEFEKYLNKNKYLHKFLIIYISLGGCQACCIADEILQTLQNREIIPRNSLISIDYNSNTWILQKIKLDRFPSIVYFEISSKNMFLYSGVFEYKNLVKWIENLNNSKIKVLKTKENVLDFYINRIDSNFKIFVLGIFYNEYDHEEDILRFKEAYEKSLKSYFEMEFAILTDDSVIKSLYHDKNSEMRAKLFGDNFYSVICIQRGGSYDFLDLSLLNSQKGNQNLSNLMSRKIIPQFSEITMKNFTEISQVNQPIFLVIVNILSNNEFFSKIQENFSRLSAIYDNHIIFGWCDGLYNPAKKLMLGHELNGKFPVAGFFTLDENATKIIYPEEWDLLDFKRILEFLDDYLELSKQQMFEKYSRKNSNKILRSGLQQNLQNGVNFVENCPNYTIDENIDQFWLKIPTFTDNTNLTKFPKKSQLRNFLESVSYAKSRLEYFNKNVKINFYITYDNDCKFLDGKYNMGLHIKINDFPQKLQNFGDFLINDGSKSIVQAILDFIKNNSEGKYFVGKHGHIQWENLEDYFMEKYNRN